MKLALTLLSLFLLNGLHVGAAAALPKDSLYSVPMRWVDDQGQATQLNQWLGQQVIITMAYSTCRNACPLTFRRLENLQSKIDSAKKSAVIIVVSLDPSVDNPETLSAFRSSHKLQYSNWHFLTGSEEDTRKLSLLLGMSYQKNPGSPDIMHSNKLSLLNKEGVMVKGLEGLNSDVTALVDSLEP